MLLLVEFFASLMGNVSGFDLLFELVLVQSVDHPLVAVVDIVHLSHSLDKLFVSDLLD